MKKNEISFRDIEESVGYFYGVIGFKESFGFLYRKGS